MPHVDIELSIRIQEHPEYVRLQAEADNLWVLYADLGNRLTDERVTLASMRDVYNAAVGYAPSMALERMDTLILLQQDVVDDLADADESTWQDLCLNAEAINTIEMQVAREYRQELAADAEYEDLVLTHQHVLTHNFQPATPSTLTKTRNGRKPDLAKQHRSTVRGNADFYFTTLQ